MEPGVNIWSGTPGLGGALTNPTELAFRKGSIQNHYPVTFQGVAYPDAEAAYQRLKRHRGDVALLTEIVTAKLQQHARLEQAITRRGGVAWLEQCRHITRNGSTWWEGTGSLSPMIRALIAAFRALEP